MTAKKEVWKWCSLYIRLRDSIDYCREAGIALDSGVVRCCSCGEIKQWRRGDAGHYIPRGSRGASGVYFDERNIHFQCSDCNAFRQGNAENYRDFMLHKYGQDVIDKLRWLDSNQSYKYKLTGLELYYKQAYEELVELAKKGDIE
ncbi:hypothetical protein LCGC14_2342850 [marine sediment metagenome]|uniref:Lambda NinG family protein n=1 Tax=marine sediment metagenome TaxID=412755 RepID=A0A0F9CZ19_9ZZZZ